MVQIVQKSLSNPNKYKDRREQHLNTTGIQDKLDTVFEHCITDPVLITALLFCRIYQFNICLLSYNPPSITANAFTVGVNIDVLLCCFVFSLITQLLISLSYRSTNVFSPFHIHTLYICHRPLCVEMMITNQSVCETLLFFFAYLLMRYS